MLPGHPTPWSPSTLRRAWRVLPAAFFLAALASCGSTETKPEPGPGTPAKTPEGGGKGPAPRAGSQPQPGPDGQGFGLAYRARALELEGEHAAAEKVWRQALAEDPSSSHLARSLAESLLRQGREIEAAGVLGEHLKVREDAATRACLVRIWDRIGRGDLADKEAESVLSRPPVDPGVAGELADRALRKGDVRAAAEALARSAAPSGRPGEPERLAGDLLLERGFAAEARERYRASLEKEPGGAARLGLARALARARSWKAAAAEAAAFADAHPRDFEAAMLAGEMLDKAGDLSGAASRFRAAAGLPGERGRASLSLARVLRRQGSRAEAAEAYRAACAASPGGPEASYELGTLLEEGGNLEEAEKALLEALGSTRGKAGHVLCALALVWARKGGDPARAREAARASLEADPQSGARIAVAGYVMHREGKAAEARASFEAALAADPDPFVLRVHGEFLSESGSGPEAAAQWRRAVELDPRLGEVLEPRIRAAERGGK